MIKQPITYDLEGFNLEEYEDLANNLYELTEDGECFEGVLNDAYFFDLGLNPPENITFLQRDGTPYTLDGRRYIALYYVYATHWSNTLHAKLTDDEGIFEEIRQQYYYDEED